MSVIRPFVLLLLLAAPVLLACAPQLGGDAPRVGNDDDGDDDDSVDDDDDDDFPVDNDGDGYTEDVDCDDFDPFTYPGAFEFCDGRDNDCDGQLPPDEVDDFDFDGFTVCDGDCDTLRADVHPGAFEICDRLDNDCNGLLPPDEFDGDSDGVAPCEGDCNDLNSSVNPWASEICNGLDDNCDGELPLDELDGDADGVPLCSDCDDEDIAAGSTAAAELCGDGIDNNCDGVIEDDESELCGCVDDLALAPLDVVQRNAICWADHVARWTSLDQARLQLRAELDTWGLGGCPTFSVQLDPIEETTTWIGGCTDENGDSFAGWAEYYLAADAYEQGPGQLVEYQQDLLSFNAFTVTPGLESPSPARSLEGQLSSWSQTQTDSEPALAGTYLTNDDCVSLAVSSQPSPSSGELATLGAGSSWSASFCHSTWDYDYVDLAGLFTCNVGAASSGGLVGAASAHPWEASFNISWQTQNVVSNPGTCAGAEPVGCTSEPWSGTLVVSLRDNPVGPITSTVSLSWDGVVACDGCAEITLNGAPVGSYCP